MSVGEIAAENNYVIHHNYEEEIEVDSKSRMTYIKLLAFKLCKCNIRAEKEERPYDEDEYQVKDLTF